MKLNLSIIIPVCNEQEIIGKNIKTFLNYFGRHKRVGKFEIIVAENGSTDKTREIARGLEKTYKLVRLIEIPKRSLGRALKLGIKKARYSYVYFNAIDNPFKFVDLEKFIGNISSCDLVFASKNHPKSVYKAGSERKIASKILQFLNKLLFGIAVSDTQGTFMGRRAKLTGILRNCTSRGAFFQTQLAIHAQRDRLRISEVPVNFRSGGRKSNFSLFRDGLMLLGEMLRERAKWR